MFAARYLLLVTCYLLLKKDSLKTPVFNRARDAVHQKFMGDLDNLNLIFLPQITLHMIGKLSITVF